jgi:Ca2+-binding EF-hand superfamily protein
VRRPQPHTQNLDPINVRSGLWGFLSAWRLLFDKFDVDRSGGISYSEFKEALVAFGYRLSPQFVQLLYRTYDRRGQNSMSFDLFVQACISLKRMTDVFKKYDEDRDGYITLSLWVPIPVLRPS